MCILLRLNGSMEVKWLDLLSQSCRIVHGGFESGNCDSTGITCSCLFYYIYFTLFGFNFHDLPPSVGIGAVEFV